MRSGPVGSLTVGCGHLMANMNAYSQVEKTRKFSRQIAVRDEQPLSVLKSQLPSPAAERQGERQVWRKT